MKKTKLIVAFPGIGKTTFAKKNKRAIDMESSNYKWIYLNQKPHVTSEELKGISKNRIPHPRWPQNYIEAVESVLTSGGFDYVLVSSEFLTFQKINYLKEFSNVIAVYPKDEFENNVNITRKYFNERYKERGNKKEFVELINKNWDKFVSTIVESDFPNEKISMKKDEYLSDVLV